VYETYDGNVVATVDARGERCSTREHRRHAVISIEDLDEPQAALAASGPSSILR